MSPVNQQGSSAPLLPDQPPAGSPEVCAATAAAAAAARVAALLKPFPIPTWGSGLLASAALPGRCSSGTNTLRAGAVREQRGRHARVRV